MKKIPIQLYQPLSEEILSKEAHSVISSVINGDTFFVFVEDYQGPKDEEDWVQTTFSLDIAQVQHLNFLIVEAHRLQLMLDVPYWLHKQFQDKEDIQIRDMIFVLLDEQHIVHGIRGIRLSVGTREAVRKIYQEQWEQEPTSEQEFTRLLNSIYAANPTPENLLEYSIMKIDWQKSVEILH